MSIGERIKELRLEKGLSQTEFGRSIGLKQAAIGLYESGSRSVSDQSISLICQKFGVSENWLRTGEGGKSRFPEFYTEVGDLVGEILEDSENPLYEMILDIVRTYIELDPKSQETIKLFINKLRDTRALKKEG